MERRKRKEITLHKTPEEIATEILDKTDADFKNNRANSWQAALKINIAIAIHEDRRAHLERTPNGEHEGKERMTQEGAPVKEKSE